MPLNYPVGGRDASGDVAFGFTDGEFGTAKFIVESYSETTPSSRVDLDDGNGKPIGSTVVPGLVEVSLTIQYGPASNDAFDIGDVVDYDGNAVVITSVEVNETQSDYVRMTIGGYKKIVGTGALDVLDDIGASS